MLPGLIDNHTHMAMPFGGTHSIDDYDTGTRAAAAGGTTCIVDFVIQQHPDGLRSSLDEWSGRADGAAHVDYGFHMAITRGRRRHVRRHGADGRGGHLHLQGLPRLQGRPDGHRIEAVAREQVRWFPAMVSNHVRDLIERYGRDGSKVPTALTDYVPEKTGYDYDEHSRVGAKHGAFVSDEICDRFCVLGTAEQAAEKLAQLESIGVDQFNIYLMTEGQEQTLETYGRDIIPRFAGVTGGSA